MEQNKIREGKNIEEDSRKLEYFMSILDMNHPFVSIKNLKTEEGVIRFKTLLLQKFWEKKNKYMHYVLILYYELKGLTDYDEITKLVQDLIETYKNLKQSKTPRNEQKILDEIKTKRITLENTINELYDIQSLIKYAD